MLVCISSHVNEFQVWGDDQLKPASQVLPILEYRMHLALERVSTNVLLATGR